jgi:hypothetical protein
MSTISGFSHTACSLAKSGFGLPLPDLPADFAIDLLAKLWSSGILTVCDHPLGNIQVGFSRCAITHWVISSNFMALTPIPTIWLYLGASEYRALSKFS